MQQASDVELAQFPKTELLKVGDYVLWTIPVIARVVTAVKTRLGSDKPLAVEWFPNLTHVIARFSWKDTKHCITRLVYHQRPGADDLIETWSVDSDGTALGSHFPEGRQAEEKIINFLVAQICINWARRGTAADHFDYRVFL